MLSSVLWSTNAEDHLPIIAQDLYCNGYVFLLSVLEDAHARSWALHANSAFQESSRQVRRHAPHFLPQALIEQVNFPQTLTHSLNRRFDAHSSARQTFAGEAWLLQSTCSVHSQFINLISFYGLYVTIAVA